jgi:hypothetical protein
VSKLITSFHNFFFFLLIQESSSCVLSFLRKHNRFLIVSFFLLFRFNPVPLSFYGPWEPHPSPFGRMLFLFLKNKLLKTIIFLKIPRELFWGVNFNDILNSKLLSMGCLKFSPIIFSLILNEILF